MSLHQLVGRQSSHALQRVDVLGVVTQQQTLLPQQANEVVAHRGLETLRQQFPSEGEERLGILYEELQLEDGLRMRQVVLVQFVVQSARRGAEIWYPSSYERRLQQDYKILLIIKSLDRATLSRIAMKN